MNKKNYFANYLRYISSYSLTLNYDSPNSPTRVQSTLIYNVRSLYESLDINKKWIKLGNPSRAAVPKTQMAASSLISTNFRSSPTFSPVPLFSRFPNRKLITFPLSKSISLHKSPSSTGSPILSLLHHKTQKRSLIPYKTYCPPCLHKLLLTTKNPFSTALDSLLILCTSVALALSLFIADVDPASAFVVTPPRKLQSDELATVQLFQENTPSVVYITNLAARYFWALTILSCAYF